MSWRFAWTPKWIVRHVLVVILCVVMVNLGLWQVRRLHEKQDRRDAVHAAEALPIAPVEEVVPHGQPGDAAVHDVQYRRATAKGRYADDESGDPDSTSTKVTQSLEDGPFPIAGSDLEFTIDWTTSGPTLRQRVVVSTTHSGD